MCQYHSSDFYPRPPCGGRLQRDLVKLVTFGFLSTPSVRRATYLQARVAFPSRHFYPRPPCGGRLNVLHQENRERLISIHALRAEGDLNTFRTNDYGRISIHALRAEGDNVFFGGIDLSCIFLSTPSVRRATAVCGILYNPARISIHALRAEGDRLRGSCWG